MTTENKSKNFSTYYCEYKLLPEHQTRDICMTFFGGMSTDDDMRELGEVKLLGRWACVGEAKGFCIAEASDHFTLQKWLNNWVTMADIKVLPCLDDNQQRLLLLGKPPDYLTSYDLVDSNAKEGESLFFIKYTFRKNCIEQGFKLFAEMTEEQDKNDSGLCTSYGRWHVPSLGCGFAIASSPSAFDLYKWAHNWNSLCSVEISPVTKDKETREIIKQGMGFSFKHHALMNQFKQLNESSIRINQENQVN